jgi:D-alanine transaminase/branched-chain amino acid aminotransferase
MATYANFNGQILEASEVKLDVTDLSVLRGYGIFDYFLVRDYVPMFLDDYLTRFYRSAELLHLQIPVGKDEMGRLIHQLVTANNMADAGIRLLLTGGYSADGYTPAIPNFLILQHPVAWVPQRDYETGIKLISHSFQRELPEVKSINYLTGIKLQKEMISAGAGEILYHNGQYWRETVRANVFFVLDQEIFTPAEKILRGITRKHILMLASKSFKIHETEVPLEYLARASEMFITSSTKGVLPVIQVDDAVIGSGTPGPVTKALRLEWEKKVQQYILGQTSRIVK